MESFFDGSDGSLGQQAEEKEVEYNM